MGKYESRTALEEWQKRDGAKPAKQLASYRYCFQNKRNCELKLADKRCIQLWFYPQSETIYWHEGYKVLVFDESSLPSILMKIAAAGGVRTCTLI